MIKNPTQPYRIEFEDNNPKNMFSDEKGQNGLMSRCIIESSVR